LITIFTISGCEKPISK